MHNSHTIFILKPDSIQRNIVDNIIKVITDDFIIIDTRKLTLSRDDVYNMKKNEWATTWDKYPTNEIIELTYEYEAKEVIAVLCKVKSNKDAFILGKSIKGNHHLAYKCNKNTIRGMFYDKEAAVNTRIYYGKVSLVFDGDTPISIPPNIIHSVDTQDEFSHLLHLAFDDIRSSYL